MESKAFAVVGTWNFAPGAEKGILVFSYETKTGKMEQLYHYDKEVSAGQQFYDEKKNILYIVDECEGKPGQVGGGGYIRAYSLNKETGELTFINEQCSLMTKPAYFWLDNSGKYGVIAAHTGRNGVTKIARQADGSLTSHVVFDDVGIALMKINDDGSLGEVCDVALYDGVTENRSQIHAHPHSVIGSPNCEIYYACDKGLDMIYSYKIDREKGKLIRMAEKKMDYATAPRYSVFHPTLPVWYENNETSPYLFAFKYDENTGGLEEISKMDVRSDKSIPSTIPDYSNTSRDKKPQAPSVGHSDVAIRPDGKFLYAGVRGVNEIAAFSIDQKTGALSQIQTISEPGGPRGLKVSPDGRFLLTANNGSGTIGCYAIAEDGMLSDTGNSAEAQFASNVGIIVC